LLATQLQWTIHDLYVADDRQWFKTRVLNGPEPSDLCKIGAAAISMLNNTTFASIFMKRHD
jgi:hypothetical protein